MKPCLLFLHLNVEHYCNIMKSVKHILGLILILAFPFGLEGQKLEFNGFIDSYHAVRIKDPHDFMSSRSRFRGEMRGLHGNTGFYASINANHNYLLPELTFLELREAYLDYAGTNWDLRAGRQIIIWGVSDGIRITDVISPMDFTEFLARDYDDIRLPVDALRFRVFSDEAKLELVYVPVFQSFIYPVNPNNPWSIIPSSQEGPNMHLVPAQTPESTLKNGEIGGKLSFYPSGYDISIYSLYTWNKLPVFEKHISAGLDTILLTPTHHRIKMVGMDVSKPIGSLVIRGEGAYFAGEYHSTQLNGNSNHLVKKDVIRYLVGLDWYPGSEWTLTGQFSHTCILYYEQILEEDNHAILATLGISKKVLRSTLSVSSFGYVDLKNQGLFNRTSIDYALSDHIHMLTGVDLFSGDKGTFGMYQDNSEIWIKMKYSF